MNRGCVKTTILIARLLLLGSGGSYYAYKRERTGLVASLASVVSSGLSFATSRSFAPDFCYERSFACLSKV